MMLVMIIKLVIIIIMTIIITKIRLISLVDKEMLIVERIISKRSYH